MKAFLKEMIDDSLKLNEKNEINDFFRNELFLPQILVFLNLLKGSRVGQK